MISKDTLDFFGEGILEQYPHDKMLKEYRNIARAVKNCYDLTQVIACSMTIGMLLTRYPLDDDFCDHLCGLTKKMRENARRGVYDRYKH